MAKLYIVTNGSFVAAATFDAEKLDAVTEKLLEHADAIEHEWRGELGDRKELFYRPRRSGRWNSRKAYLTEVEVELPDTETPKPRYEAKGSVVYDTLRHAVAGSMDSSESAIAYAKSLNEAYEKGH